ncbi:MAG: adenylate/guanylate cyclase domain-containing protein [Chloroflexi bacterium]|nr:adenylate/guanylate cyclase domain-containing protein [Chloroflexota bacterium]
MEQEIRFCTSADGTRLAYGIYCDGDGLPVVRVSSWLVTEELNWDEHGFRGISENLGPGRCLYSFDRRGIGASQREVEDVSLDNQVADLTAIVNDAGLKRFDLAGWLDGCAVSVAYAARYPERVEKLALQMPMMRGDDSWRLENVRSLIELTETNWPLARRTISDIYHPYATAENRRALKNAIELGLSANVAAKYLQFTSNYDVSPDLPNIQVPTLVIALRAQGPRSVAATSAVASQIPDAQLVTRDTVRELVGDDPAGGDLKAVAPTVTEIMREFFEQGRARPTAKASGMTAILFLDIADSTALTTKLGDAAYRERERELDGKLRAAITDAGGTPIEGKVLGDGVMAVFTSARQAIEAAQRCRDLGNEAGLPLHLGIHAGDVVREGNNVHGGAVQVAARVQGVAEPGEILVSATVRDLARTSAGVQFEDRGEHELKGIPEPQRLFAVRDSD